MIGIYIAIGIVVIFLIPFLICYFITIRLHRNMFGSRFQNDPRIHYYTKEEFGLSFTPISVPMEDVMLKGGIYYYPNPNLQKLIIFNHGMWSGVDSYLQDIEYFCKKGYQVLAIEHEGTNQSEGKSIRGLVNSVRCLDYVLKYCKQDLVLKHMEYYVVGHSWGGFATVGITNYHKDIKGIMAMAPFYSMFSCLKGMLNKWLWISFLCFWLVERKECGKYANTNGFKGISHFMGNVVILHSKNDNMVKFRYNTARLQKKNIKNVSYFIMDSRDHNPNYTDDSIKRLREFSLNMRNLKTNEERTKYMETVDFHKLGELDTVLMDEALEMLLK